MNAANILIGLNKVKESLQTALDVFGNVDPETNYSGLTQENIDFLSIAVTPFTTAIPDQNDPV